MNTFSIGEMVTFGWETFKRRPWLFVGAIGIIAVVEVAISAIGNIPVLGFFVSLATGTFVGMGMVQFSLRSHDSIGDAKFGDLWIAKPFWRFLGATLLRGLIVAGPIVVGAMILGVSAAMAGKPGTGFSMTSGFIVPAIIGLVLAFAWMIYASVRLIFVEYLVVEVGKGPVEAVKESFRTTQWSVGKLMLLMLALGCINILGALALLVGLLVSIPVTMLAMAHAYRTLYVATPAPAASAPAAPVPPAPTA